MTTVVEGTASVADRAASAAPERAAVSRIPFGAGDLGLLGIVVISWGIAVVTAQHRSSLSPPSHAGFPSWYAGPLHGLLPGVTTDRATLSLRFAIAVMAMCACWLLVLARRRHLRAGPVIGAVVAAHVAFLLSPPLTLTDLFNYLGYARLDAVHHLNPYTALPLANRGDALYHFSNWHRLHSPYGPLFTLLTLPLAHLPLAAAYWVYKAAVMVASLGCAALVWAIARATGRDAVAALAFAALNPLLLIYGLGGQHNDVFMLLALLAGVWWIVTGRERRGGAAVVLAVGVKASAGVLAPALLLLAPRRQRAFAGALLGAVGLVAVTVAAFGPHLPALGTQSRLVSTLSVPNVVGLLGGRGGADPQLRSLATKLLVAGAAAATVVAWRRRALALDAVAVIALLSVAALSWVMPWYVTWALPFAALALTPRLRGAAIVATVYLALTWSPLAIPALHREGVFPSRTAVGRVNHAYFVSLVHDHPPRRHHHRRHHVRAARHARARAGSGRHAGGARGH